MGLYIHPCNTRSFNSNILGYHKNQEQYPLDQDNIICSSFMQVLPSDVGSATRQRAHGATMVLAACLWACHGPGSACMAALTLVAYPHMSKGGYLGMPWPWQLAWWAAKNMPYCPHSIQTFPGITRTKSNFPFTKTILIVLPSKLGEKIVEWFLLFYFSDNNRLMVQPGLPDYY